MKIAYVSDLHIDFWIKERNVFSPKYKRSMKEYIDLLNPDKADILLIAGDISHYNEDIIYFCTIMKKTYNTVIITEGNHDKYVLPDIPHSKYKGSSINKRNELKELCLLNDIIYLDGDVVTIDNVKIAGTSMWYDLSKDTLNLYKDMNDSKYIKNFSSIEYYSSEVEKLKKLKDIDIFLSHVSPVKIPDNLREPRFKHSEYNIFFESDNLDLIKKTNAKHCVFGHIHLAETFKIEDINFYVSAIGYPNENKYNTIKYFEV